MRSGLRTPRPPPPHTAQPPSPDGHSHEGAALRSPPPASVEGPLGGPQHGVSRRDPGSRDPGRGQECQGAAERHPAPGAVVLAVASVAPFPPRATAHLNPAPGAPRLSEPGRDPSDARREGVLGLEPHQRCEGAERNRRGSRRQSPRAPTVVSVVGWRGFRDPTRRLGGPSTPKTAPVVAVVGCRVPGRHSSCGVSPSRCAQCIAALDLRTTWSSRKRRESGHDSGWGRGGRGGGARSVAADARAAGKASSVAGEVCRALAARGVHGGKPTPARHVFPLTTLVGRSGGPTAASIGGADGCDGGDARRSRLDRSRRLVAARARARP